MEGITRLDRRESRDADMLERLCAIWEASVRATHHFLSEEDIRALVPFVRAALGQIPLLCVWRDKDGCPQAFAGVEGDKLEMLFVHPRERGRGAGKRLLRFAVNELGVRRLDVNEQNPQGVGFYEHMGFRTVGRSETDGQGKPFPLLHMALLGKTAT